MDESGYRALRDGVAGVRLPRDVVLARGDETLPFLQGQLSQDLAALSEGETCLSWLLQPQGKVDALVRVTRLAGTEVMLDTDGGWGDAVLARLQRFKLRVKCDLERLDWHCLALRGPRAHDVDVTTRGYGTVDADWPGLPGVDLFSELPPPLPDGVTECDLDAWEAARIEAGLPVMGREIDERTIPAEMGPELIARTVSFTKGCYTGQELVARIDSRGGHVPRRLRGVVVTGRDVPPPGATVQAGGAVVGALTSVAWSPRAGAAVALASIKRDVMPPADVTVTWDGGEAAARVEDLPLLS